MSILTLSPQHVPHQALQQRSAVYLNATGLRPVEHEVATHCITASKLARLQGMEFAGVYDSSQAYPGPLYLVPHDTLNLEDARELGIRDASELFGGVVSQPFMATKAISHELINGARETPEHWVHEFARRVAGDVLNGWTAFSRRDALRAGMQLLELGPVRIKPVRATAGRGQHSVETEAQLQAALDAQEDDEIARYGLVLEEHLDDVHTYSVGLVEVGDLLVSYYGVQNLTEDNHGQTVYGGSHLSVVRGGFDRLLALNPPEPLRQAVWQAARFDQAALECLPGFFASRRNYDIAAGIGWQQQRRCGVLEQSWRIGGASSAEAAALEIFQQKPDVQRVRSSSIELYGAHRRLPEGVTVLFSGEDSDVGFISKCVKVQEDDYQQQGH